MNDPVSSEGDAHVAVAQGLQFKAPEKLNFEADNMQHEWKKWKELELYTTLSVERRTQSVKIQFFKYLIGQEGREVYKTLSIEGGDNSGTLKNVLHAFCAHYNPKQSEIVERYKFFTRNQESGENFYRYFTELRKLSATCNFGNISDSLTRDRIICRLQNTGLRERLLRESGLTLEKCVSIYKASELSKAHSKAIDSQETVNWVKKNPEERIPNSKNKVAKSSREVKGKSRKERQKELEKKICFTANLCACRYKLFQKCVISNDHNCHNLNCYNPPVKCIKCEIGRASCRERV